MIMLQHAAPYTRILMSDHLRVMPDQLTVFDRTTVLAVLKSFCNLSNSFPRCYPHNTTQISVLLAYLDLSYRFLVFAKLVPLTLLRNHYRSPIRLCYHPALYVPIFLCICATKPR